MVLFLAFVVLSSSVAQAQLIWDWTYMTTSEGSDIYSGGGTLTTTLTPVSGAYTITGITGTWSFTGGVLADPLAGTYAITGLSAPGTDIFGFENDNLLNISGLLLTENGLTFTDSSGNRNNIYSLGSSYEVLTDGGEDGHGTFTATQEVAAVPEPSSIGLMAIVLLFLAWSGRSRIRRSDFNN